jgi:hypothetical protein
VRRVLRGEVEDDRRAARLLELRLVDHVEAEHEREHVVTTTLGPSRMTDRVVVDRRGDQAGERSRLRQGELERLDPEVGLRSSQDPVRAVAEVHGVEVPGQDPVLAQPLLELPREVCLTDLAPDRQFVTDVELLHELLGDRRAALDDLASGGVSVGGSQQRPHVQPRVIVEALILDRDHRVAHDIGDLPRADDHPVLARVQRGDQRPVGRVDEGGLREGVRVLARLVERGEVARGCCEGEHEHADQEGPRARGHGFTILPRVEASHC